LFDWIFFAGGVYMFKILSNEMIAENIYKMDILAPRVAKSAKPGQFIIVRVDDKGERVPLTISDFDSERGSVQIVVQALGHSTKKLVSLGSGEFVKDFAGPLGNASDFISEDFELLRNKKVVFVGGGVGAAPVYPQVKFFSDLGICTDVVLGFKNENFVILKNEFESLNANVHFCTDDGSFGFKGLVTDKLEELIKSKNIDIVVTIGPMIMMKFVAELTKKYDIKTIASLNTLMVDGTGMCGGCRVSVNDEIKFTCVDGPEFDAHLVDFDEAMSRQSTYKEEENHKCRLDGDLNV
jgi:ferredoxin--NADP+ reductase